MKRILALMLALMMCLSLCACGGGNDTPTTGQNEQLDNNPPSAQETPTETTVPETTQTVIPSHPLLKNIYGDWTIIDAEQGEKAGSPCSAFSINEDGTCVADDRNGTWKINESTTNEEHLWIDVYFDGTYEYCISYYIWNNTDKVNIGSYPGTFLITGGFMKSDSIVSVEITPENWMEYFEITEIEEYVVDDFGDFEYFTKEWCLTLKPEYEPIYGKEYENLAFEISYTIADTNFEFDHDNKTIIVSGEPQNPQEITEKYEIRLSWGSSNNYIQIIGDRVGETYTTIKSVSDIQVLRVAGDTNIVLQKVR